MIVPRQSYFTLSLTIRTRIQCFLLVPVASITLNNLIHLEIVKVAAYLVETVKISVQSAEDCLRIFGEKHSLVFCFNHESGQKIVVAVLHL